MLPLSCTTIINLIMTSCFSFFLIFIAIYMGSFLIYLMLKLRRECLQLVVCLYSQLYVLACVIMLLRVVKHFKIWIFRRKYGIFLNMFSEFFLNVFCSFKWIAWQFASSLFNCWYYVSSISSATNLLPSAVILQKMLIIQSYFLYLMVHQITIIDRSLIHLGQ